MTSKPAKDLAFTVSSNKTFKIGPFSAFGGSFDSALSALTELVEDKRSHLVITCNVDQTINLTGSSELWHAYSEASLITIDGAPLVALAHILGATDVHRITGADLLPAVCASTALTGKRIAITGGRGDTLKRAVENLQNVNSHVDVRDFPFPMLTAVDDKKSLKVIKALQEYKPHIVFVCLGSPKQEAWYMTWREHLPQSVYIGVGAAVDFAAGSVSRAPRWMQRTGLEWTYRLSKEPKRLAHRYLVRGMLFVPILLRSVARLNSDRRPLVGFEGRRD